MAVVLGAGELEVDLPRLASELTAALRAGPAEPGQRVRAQVTPDVTAMVLMPGLAAGIPAYTVKVHAKNPNRSPAITGVICLHDLATGDLLALIDSSHLTALRTGLGGALGAHLLARPDARHVTVIGAGAQGRAQLQALAALRPIESVLVRDTDPAAARKFAAWAEELGIRASGAAEGEIVLMATWSRVPVLHEVSPGTHITSLGADEPGKVELAPGILDSALVVVDDPGLAHVAADTTIGAVLRGEHPGRTGADQVTVYSPAGLPMQDLVIAWHVYRNARRKSPAVFDIGVSQRYESR
ncbi:ornithine cyclodeaminase family protein [Lentzea sp. PSKA42]|uniref:Ornithine cyclodeaminase family protein n=1 Tax=Lentzea indica TaxID=2604800 RepID=A0ABX1FIU6_9PSEU|nr:ornithine cyclodeaminase family protein [Lentzea indica]NKE58522.1 ornithine cyclodeaminase family protein [Lentzea indica]